MKEITSVELKKRLDLRDQKKDSFYLLDVRNQNEVEICTIPGTDKLIPVGELESKKNELDDLKSKEIIVYCRSGGRSSTACSLLSSAGFQSVINLKGGILDYSSQVDPSLPKY